MTIRKYAYCIAPTSKLSTADAEARIARAVSHHVQQHVCEKCRHCGDIIRQCRCIAPHETTYANCGACPRNAEPCAVCGVVGTYAGSKRCLEHLQPPRGYPSARYVSRGFEPSLAPFSFPLGSSAAVVEAASACLGSTSTRATARTPWGDEIPREGASDGRR